ncbi:MAG: hypothetical protein HLUCCO16_08910 [Phormidium sp. OSCR]|nr:MAG: hypothetical protein HLUCCO16_08910 [Phormidium sp. OSCR]
MSASDYPWNAWSGAWPKVYFVLLTVSSLVSWFRQFADLMVESDRREIKDRDYLEFTLLKKTESENYQVAQGIFAQKDSKVYDVRVIEASSVDSEILKAHDFGKTELAFWS